MMRPDFCAFILTHGRPHRVVTYRTLRKSGYTGPIFLVIDDEDKQGDEYRKTFGDEVVTFSKEDIAARFDEADNFGDRRSIFYARNACFDLARELGYRYFIQLDDDYTSFHLRFNAAHEYGHTPSMKRSLDEVLEALLEFFIATPAHSVAMAQGGDHIGGDSEKRRPKLMRKAMNTFICSVDRPFEFMGRINEDVNTYTAGGRAGLLFLTVFQAQVNQMTTQANAGGMTDLYLDSGTFVKSFYSVMFAPSCVKVGELSDPRSPHSRLHHAVDWKRTAPKILSESLRKPR